MKNILLANIGNNDVKYQSCNITSAREKGKKILDDFDKHKGDLTFPILQPAIDKIIRDHKQLERVHLFITDQQKPHEQDTLYFGEIIEKWLKELNANIRCKLEIMKRNPHRYDYMFSFYERELKKLNKNDRYFCLLSGGLPACNMSLLFNSFSIFGEQATHLYVEKGSADVKCLHVSSNLDDWYQKRSIYSCLEQYNYAAIQSLPVLQNKNVQELVKSAKSRAAFNFESSLMSLEKYESAIEKSNPLIENLKKHLEVLKSKQNVETLLQELILNCKIKYKNKEYADVLGRLFRLNEGMLRWAIEHKDVLGVTTEKDRGNGFTEFCDSINCNKELKKYLDKKNIEYKKPTLMNMSAIIQFFIDNKDIDDKFRDIFEINKSFTKASELRNKSIIAHGFQGISENDIKNLDIESIIERIEGVFNFDLESISFDKMEELIRKEIDKL